MPGENPSSSKFRCFAPEHFEIMVRDELLLNLPISPLCAPECEGLVAEAGSGLNTDLSEDEVNERSPFSVLKDLLDTGD